jgi:hypothetical protein
MPTTDLREHLVNGGRVERAGAILRLAVPPTGADAYTDAQLDDYEHGLPRHFTNAPPQRLRLRARFSHRQMKGTAGFGFWNHPFSREGAVLEPPCNVWFFYNSPESNLAVARGVPGHGFKAAVLHSLPLPSGERAGVRGKLTGALMSIANLLLKLPLLSTLTMAAARAVVNAREIMLNLDMTAWHEYEIDWRPDVAVLRVDQREVLRAPRPPTARMGFVAWVDNYRASTRGGQYGFAYVNVPAEQWMELEIMGADD